MQPISSPSPARWQAPSEHPDGPLPTGHLFTLALRQCAAARVAPDPVRAVKLPVPPATVMAPSEASGMAASSSLAATLLGFLGRMTAPRARAAQVAVLAVLACLVPTVAAGVPEAPRSTPPTYQAVAQVLASKLGRVPSPALVRGVVPRFPLDASGLPSGLYLVRMTAGRFTATRPLVIAR
jgi:hypothetical protein